MVSGELINVVHPMEESLKFIVEGVFDHYLIQEDGSPYLIAHCDGFGFMGDLAFCRRQLQRVLKDLTAKGILIRTGKGHYPLRDA